MPSRPWTTTPQVLWLHERLPAYHDAQRCNNVSRHLITIYEAWFRDFPLRLELFPNKPVAELLSAEENDKLYEFVERRKNQIKSWYNNRRLMSSRSSSRSSTSSRGHMSDTSDIISYLDLQPDKRERAGRAPQRVEAFQILHPKLMRDMIKRVITLNPPAHGVPSKIAMLKIRRYVSKRLLEQAPQEVQDEITKYIEDWKRDHSEGIAKELCPSGDAHEDVCTPQSYQDAISNLPRIMEALIGPCANATGWTFCIIAGGPSPAMNGRIYMEQYHFGPKSQAGNVFSDAYIDFKKNVLNPFSNHLLNCFPPDVRQTRAIRSNHMDASELAGDPSGASTSTPGPSKASSTGASMHDVINGRAADHDVDAVPEAFMDFDNGSLDFGISWANGTTGGLGTAQSGDLLGLHSQATVTSSLDDGDDALAAMGNLSLTGDIFAGMDIEGEDYMQSVFRDLPALDFASLGGTSTTPVPQHAPAPNANNSQMGVDGFIFPPMADVQSPGPATSSPLSIDQGITNNFIIGHAHSTSVGPPVEPLLSPPVGESGAPAADAQMTGPLGSPSAGMREISDHAVEIEPTLQVAWNKGKGKAVDTGLQAESEIGGRPKRKIVAPPRRDKTPEPAAALLRKRRA